LRAEAGGRQVGRLGDGPIAAGTLHRVGDARLPQEFGVLGEQALSAILLITALTAVAAVVSGLPAVFRNRGRITILAVPPAVHAAVRRRG
jgi:hypothetical protein